LVTAFGPFDGRPENASGLALRQLRKSLPWLRTRTFPVDSVTAPKRLREALRTLRPELLVLLGEAAGSKTIRLEQSAWNELDFRIPDVAGRQPQGRSILPDGPTERRTPLPLAALQRHLVDADHPVTLSSDPGRYLCNQLYYLGATALPATLFIHLPLAQDLPTHAATAALAEALEFLIAHRTGES
jgi:pyroglutamyl-peptidase